MKERSTPK